GLVLLEIPRLFRQVGRNQHARNHCGNERDRMAQLHCSSRMRISESQWICRHHFGEETIKFAATGSMANPLADHEGGDDDPRATRASDGVDIVILELREEETRTRVYDGCRTDFDPLVENCKGQCSEVGS